ncbi:MAG: Zn-dependent protease, partial [Proteobacteria bacterium]|nr:Zn-dependent protease [Pseudomonadota bacterium]
MSVDPFNPLIRIEMGRIYLESKETQKAFNMLQDIESDPVLGLLAKSYLGSAYLELGNLEKAKISFLQI